MVNSKFPSIDGRKSKKNGNSQTFWIPFSAAKQETDQVQTRWARLSLKRTAFSILVNSHDEITNMQRVGVYPAFRSAGEKFQEFQELLILLPARWIIRAVSVSNNLIHENLIIFYLLVPIRRQYPLKSHLGIVMVYRIHSHLGNEVCLWPFLGDSLEEPYCCPQWAVCHKFTDQRLVPSRLFIGDLPRHN